MWTCGLDRCQPRRGLPRSSNSVALLLQRRSRCCWRRLLLQRPVSEKMVMGDGKKINCRSKERASYSRKRQGLSRKQNNKRTYELYCKGTQTQRITSRFEIAFRADATTSSNCNWLLRSATAAGLRTRMNRWGRRRKKAKSSCSRKTRIMSLGKEVTKWPVAGSFTLLMWIHRLSNDLKSEKKDPSIKERRKASRLKKCTR